MADSALIAALASGATRQKAAEQAGVSVATVYRRLADESFRAELEAACEELVTQTVAALTALGPLCVATLTDLLGPKIPPTVRLGAAKAGLELAAKSREDRDLEARIAALEEQLAVQPETRSRWAA